MRSDGAVVAVGADAREVVTSRPSRRSRAAASSQVRAAPSGSVPDSKRKVSPSAFCTAIASLGR